MIAVVMGVSGAGKSKVGSLVAAQLRWNFVDADDLHSESNVAKMHAGIPLSDQDRQPWLQRVHEVASEFDRDNESAVIACSALKEAYRRIIAPTNEPQVVRFILLEVDREILQSRLAHRTQHYMNPGLLPSQLETLEVSGVDMVVTNNGSLDDVVASIVAYLERESAIRNLEPDGGEVTSKKGDVIA